jgi:hypothetical protein
MPMMGASGPLKRSLPLIYIACHSPVSVSPDEIALLYSAAGLLARVITRFSTFPENSSGILENLSTLTVAGAAIDLNALHSHYIPFSPVDEIDGTALRKLYQLAPSMTSGNCRPSQTFVCALILRNEISLLIFF